MAGSYLGGDYNLNIGGTSSGDSGGYATYSNSGVSTSSGGGGGGGMTGGNAMAGLGMLTQAWGSVRQSEATQESAHTNEIRALANADQAIAEAVKNERRLRVYGQKVIGDIRASYGASGVTTESGSVTDVLQTSARNIELDAQDVRLKGRMRADAFRNEAADFKKQGSRAKEDKWMGVANAFFGAAGGMG